jgi:hypothetical protein
MKNGKQIFIFNFDITNILNPIFFGFRKIRVSQYIIKTIYIIDNFQIVLQYV